MRRSPRLDHSQEAEKELAVAALLACTAEVRQPTFGVAREEHVRLPLAVALRSPGRQWPQQRRQQRRLARPLSSGGRKAFGLLQP